MSDATNSDHEKSNQQVTEPVPEKTRKRSYMYLLAHTIGDFTCVYLKNSVENGELLVTAWRRLVYLLAMFNIQIYIKTREETGRDGVIRLLFFVTRGNPRPMTSFKLPSAYGRGFMSLDTHTRAIASRSFVENKGDIKYLDEPLKDFTDESQRETALEIVSNLLSHPESQ